MNILQRIFGLRLVSHDRLLVEKRRTAQMRRLEIMIQRLVRDVELVKLGTTVVVRPDRAIALLATGDRIYVDPRDRGCGVNLMAQGRYEDSEFRVFRRFLKPGSVVLDVGANYGYYSICAAPYLRPGGRVIGFEPNPHVHELFRSSVYLNGMSDVVETHCLGAYDSDGALGFEIDPTGPGGAHVIRPDGRPLPENQVIEVPVAKLDGFLPADLIVDLVKMDVEGHEVHALRGMREIIARSPDIVILVEFISDFFESKEAFADYVRLIRDELGLSIYRIVGVGDVRRVEPDELRGSACSLVLTRRALVDGPDLTILPAQMIRRHTADIVDGMLRWSARDDAPGEHTVAHGPYVFLPKGTYELRIDADVEGVFSCRVNENFGDVLWSDSLQEGSTGRYEVVIPMDAPRMEVAIFSEERSSTLRLRSIEFWPR